MALEKHELDELNSDNLATVDMLSESKVLKIGEDEPSEEEVQYNQYFARFFNVDKGQDIFSLRWYLNVLMQNWSVSFQLVLSAFFVQMFALWMPIFYIIIFDRVYGRYNLATLDVMGVGIILIVGFDIIIKMLRSYLMSHQMKWLDKLTSHYLISRMSDQVSVVSINQSISLIPERFTEMIRVNKVVTQTLFMTCLDTLFSGLIIAILIQLNATLAMVSLLPLIPLALYFFWHTPRAKMRSQTYARTQKKCQLNLSEMVNHQETLASLNAEKYYKKTVMNRIHHFITDSFGSNLDMTGQSNVQGFFINLGSMITLYVGAHVVLSGEINFGVYIAINMMSRTVLGTFQKFLATLTNYQEMMASMGNLKEILPEYENSDGVKPRAGQAVLDQPLSGEMTFNDVQFHYPTDEQLILEGVNFSVNPGERLVITGKSGCGKTTLVRLMQNLIQPTGGYITLDGLNVLDINKESLRGRVGAAVQKPAMFSGTLEDNLRLGNPEVSAQDIVKMAELAGMTDMLNQSKDGLNTEILPMGMNLSGGQIQRVSLARVLMKNPNILILDEALTALPPSMRVEIINNIHKAFKGKTCIFISNFIPLHQVADRILVLDKGKIVEEGKFLELIEKQGVYYSLNNSSPQKPEKSQEIQAGFPEGLE